MVLLKKYYSCFLAIVFRFNVYKPLLFILNTHHPCPTYYILTLHKKNKSKIAYSTHQWGCIILKQLENTINLKCKSHINDFIVFINLQPVIVPPSILHTTIS